MKRILFVIAIVSIIAIDACKDEHNPAPVPTYTATPAPPDNYSSIGDFFNKNATPMQTFTVSAATGGTFTTPQGTIVSVGANAFMDQSYNPITSGTVTIEFKDFYKKSDMLLNDMPTTYYTGGALKSGGEFFIKAMQGNNVLQLMGAQPIVVNQPFIGAGIDTGMKAMGIFGGTGPAAWNPAPRDTFGVPYDSLTMSLSQYVFSIYQFNAPVDSGSWCNSDNPTFFAAYTQTSLTMIANDSVSVYGTYVFLLFKNLNSMVHVYDYRLNSNGESFPYIYAPIGLPCTVVAVGVKNGTVYSSFTPITISANQTVNFTLSPTTTAAFKAAVQALD